MEKLYKKIRINNLIVRFITAWLFSGVLLIHRMERIGVYKFESFRELNVLPSVISFLAVFISISLFNWVFKENKFIKFYDWKKKASIIDYTALLIMIIVFAVESVYKMRDFNVVLPICGITAWFVFYILMTFKEFYFGKKISEKIANRISVATVLIFMIVAGTLLLALLVLRYYVFRTSTYDFGIFAQMYYYMKKAFVPITTCERNRLLSHFSVHVSPIFYIVLPFYYVFPSPVTLIVCQFIFLLSGIIPVYLLCKKKGLSNLITTCISLLYLTYPTLYSGLFYDFHENKFLPPLILWLVYFVEKENVVGTILFAIYTLLVKEDAAIYVACVGLFMIFGKKGKKNKILGALTIITAVAYFFCLYHFLANSGDGAMIDRYGNFVMEDDGALGILVTVFKNPSYFVSQIMSEDKLKTFMWLFVPVTFIPFYSKKIPSYILLIPCLVITFMTSYPYQCTIDYQYAYGSAALIIYTVILYFSGELSDNQENRDVYKLNTQAVMVSVLSLIMVVSIVSDRSYYFDEYKNQNDMFEQVDNMLNTIPKDATVTATTFYLTHMTDRDEIYMFDENKDFDTEYMVYDLRYADVGETYMADAVEKQENGYTVYDEIDGWLLILKKD